MKKFIILLLLIALLAAAHFTRPQDPQTSLTHLMVAQLPPQEKSIVDATGGESVVATNVGQHVVFKDRFLWVDAQVNGKTVFTGAFAHWFPRADVAYKVLMGLENLKDKMTNEVKNLAPAAGAAGDKVKDGIQDLTDKVKLPGQ